MKASPGCRKISTFSESESNRVRTSLPEDRSFFPCFEARNVSKSCIATLLMIRKIPESRRIKVPAGSRKDGLKSCGGPETLSSITAHPVFLLCLVPFSN